MTTPHPTKSAPAPSVTYTELPDFETVEQHIYGACRRYITQDMLEPIHNLIRDAIDADRAMRAQAAPAQERHRFYVGVKDCGCITATLVDDSITKPKEIADFAREMEKTGRRIRTGIASSRSPSMSTDFQNPRASARGAVNKSWTTC